jgi:tetratricopeptide (TPR) repeat protein
MTRQTWAIAVVAILSCVPLFALDTIVRKSDGKSVTGTITDMNRNEINVKKSVGEPEVIQANDVASISWGDGGADLRLGYTDENAGKPETALTRYAKAKADAKNPSEHLKAEFDYVIARANAMVAMNDPAKQDAAVKQLQAIQKSRPEHFRYYESINVLGQLQLAMKDYAGARVTFEQLAKAPWGDYKLLARIASGRVYVAEDKLDEAAKEFEAAAAAATNSPADQARKYEAMLGQAQALIAQSKFEDALKILELVTDKGPADESALQAEAYVLQGNALQALGRMKEAALAYLHVDILFPKETSLHAEALFNLGKTWRQVQLPDRAADAEAKLIQLYPNSAWRKKL